MRSVRRLLEKRERRGDLGLFNRVLARVPDVPPAPGDELPNAPRQADRALQPSSRGRRNAPGQSRDHAAGRAQSLWARGTSLAVPHNEWTMRIDRILVPTDFGRPARTAWGYAQDLAARFKSRIHLVHVLTPPPFVSDPLGADRLTLQVADLLRESAGDAKRALDREPAAPALRDRIVRKVLTGTPLDEIRRTPRNSGSTSS